MDPAPSLRLSAPTLRVQGCLFGDVPHAPSSSDLIVYSTVPAQLQPTAQGTCTSILYTIRSFPLPMHPVASSIVDHARRNHHVFIPLVFSVLAATTNVHAPVKHHLLITSASWAVVCIATLFRTGFRTPDAARRRTSWLAAGLLALAQICERAACDKEGTWSTKVSPSSCHSTCQG